MNVGIDASNLRSGGGVTYVVELLAHADPARHGIRKVTLWASSAMLGRTAARPWLERVHVPAFEGTLPRRIAWQIFERSRLARESCDVLFAPGATPVGSFRPQVSMSTNMLPFAPEEGARYGWSPDRFRFILLRAQQSLSLRRSSAVIFLTDYARSHISSLAGLPDTARTDVIPSGVNERFRSAPRIPRPLASHSAADPFRFLYVSDIHPYKHQWNVVEAVARLYHDGLPVALDIIGYPAHPRATRQLRATLARLNGAGDVIRFLGPMSHDALPPIYRQAGAFIFASTCENLPLTLVEAMASGLPIAASRVRPMSDILGEGQVAFDPESVASIEDALRTLAMDHERRGAIAQQAYDAATHYSWDECSDRTFALLAEVGRQSR